MNIRNNELDNKSLNSFYPLPDLPPRGKEFHVRLFPRGGNGKGGYLKQDGGTYM
jgi:hypothetical protein